jgi:hypothetical protein
MRSTSKDAVKPMPLVLGQNENNRENNPALRGPGVNTNAPQLAPSSQTEDPVTLIA